MINISRIKKQVIQLIAGAGILFIAGCTTSLSTDVDSQSVSGIPTRVAEETISSAPTELPVPTVTAVPTETPAPTPSPTPTVLSVYEQILALEDAGNTDPDIPVKAALLVNITEDTVIYSEHAVEVIYPASITKLMTAYVAYSLEDDFTQTVEISKTAATPVIPSAKMCGFKAGDRIRLNDLMRSMLVYSGNDTSVAVAEHIAGSEEAFVELMNQKAEELQLKVSHFCNSHGLPDDNHVTSAYDIYLIMQKLFNFEDFCGIIGLGSIELDVLRGESLHTFQFASTNQFLWGSYQLPDGLILIGGKTGTTNKAGCCLALYVKDAEGNCYIAEIFGAESYETLYPSMIQLLTHISDE